MFETDTAGIGNPAGHQQVPDPELPGGEVVLIEHQDLLGQGQGEFGHARVVQSPGKRDPGFAAPGGIVHGSDPLGDGLLVPAEVPVEADQCHATPGRVRIESEGLSSVVQGVGQRVDLGEGPTGEVGAPLRVAIEGVAVGERGRDLDDLAEQREGSEKVG